MRLRLVWIAPLATFLLAGGCDCSGPPSGCASGDDCFAGELCRDGRCVPRPDGAVPDAGPGGGMDAGRRDAGAPACTVDSECGGGVCVEGACCPSADAVCGGACCGDGETCFGSACVVPGDRCVTNRDCGDGEYCEPGLGDGPAPDAGTPDGGVGCGASGGGGRCLALPPTCDDAAPGAPCVLASCEFRPAVGALNAVPQWRWDPDTAVEEPTRVDVWSTPVVGRLFDTNCDGAIDELDPSAIVFVSNDVRSGACHGPDLCRRGVLRALDGASGRELWSLAGVDSASIGFSGVSLALGDLDDDGVMDIVALTGERRLAAIRGDGTVMAVGTDTLPATTDSGLGWGGGLALADMDGDGDPEVAWRGAVYTYAAGAFTERFDVASARGGWPHGTVSTSTSFFVNLDGDDDLELLSGRTAIDTDGSVMWQRTDLTEGFAAVGDFDGDPTAPEVVLVGGGQVSILAAATGATLLGPTAIGGTGAGGPPTVADFDGDGAPEIGVAQATVYAMLKPNFTAGTIDTVWTTTNHDNSSSVTGSTVFDFEGDGVAEVVYNDECYMWVYDGPTGNVRFAAPTNSFTGTEASLVADVDGDGHAEMVMISTGANPESWHCNHHSTGDATYPAWSPPSYGPSWRGISVFRDSANSWVGTRTMWTQHAYHVTNTCDDGDSACGAPNTYGAIPMRQRPNWTLPWLNNFRQNVQEGGIFDAPDAVLDLRVICSDPVRLIVSLRNQGRALLPPGVEIEVVQRGAPDTVLGTVTSTEAVFPGRVVELALEAPAGVLATETFFARVAVDPATATFRECDEDNNQSEDATGRCLE